MKCNTISQKLKNITSIGITLIIVILLILSGPANAVLVEISGLSSEYTKGNEVKFKISITLHDIDEYVPITNFSLNLTGPTPNVWIFNTTGTVIPEDTSNITIIGVSTPEAAHYGEGIGHAEDANTGDKFDFPYGFGYGSNSGGGGDNVTYNYTVTLYTTNLATGDYKVTASLNTEKDNIGNEISFTSTEAEFSIKAYVPPPSGGGGGGGGGGGASGEAYENIVCTETDRQYVSKDQSVKYNFTLECNYVQHIEFTGLTSAGKVAAKVVILNHTSTTVDKDAPDIVFKNLNVWVGNMGYFSDKNVKDPTITFKVNRSWVNDNDIILNTISFCTYNDDNKTWENMSTQKIGEDSISYQFKASLPIRGNLGPMAISGKELVYIPTPVPTPTPTPVITPTLNITENTTLEITSNTTPVTWTGTWKANVPGFHMLTAIIALITLYFISRRRD